MTIWKRFLRIFRRDKKITGTVEKKEILVYEPIQTSLEKDIEKKREVFQSYILTAAKYNFSEYEKNILSNLVECFQLQLKGQELGAGFFITQSQQGDVDVILPISSLRVGEDLKIDHEQLEKSLYSLQNRMVNYKNNEVWVSVGLIERPEINTKNHSLQFRLHHRVREALMSFSSGHRKQELDEVMSFRSIYAQHFHELLRGTNVPVRYDIDKLKAMFQLENKYKPIKIFISRVIEQAKKELDVKGPFSFTYQLEYEKERQQRGRKRIIAIVFTPVYPFEQHLEKSIKTHRAKSGINSSVSHKVIKKALKNPTTKGNSKRTTTDKQRVGVRYFLEEILGIDNGRELDELVDLTLSKGGNKYLTNLFRTCNRDVEVTIEKLRQLKIDSLSVPVSEPVEAAKHDSNISH